MIHFFFKLASSRGAPQENDAKFRLAIHPQGFRQFHDNCKIAKVPDCCHISAQEYMCLAGAVANVTDSGPL